MTMKIGEHVKIGIGVIVYFFACSAVPIYNKKVFSGFTGETVPPFAYPCATAALQLSFVSLIFIIMNAVAHAYSCIKSSPAVTSTWIGGGHLAYKLRHAAPAGLLFGIKYGISNLGLELVPTGTHLLLQSTDLLWTWLFARLYNRERNTAPAVLLAVALSTIGSVMIGTDATATIDAPFFPLLVNLLTPVILAASIATVRSGTTELCTAKATPVLGCPMSPVEFTAIKLFLSASVAFCLSLLLESGFVEIKTPGVQQLPEAWWSAFNAYPTAGKIQLFSGALFVALFQVNLTWLTTLTSAMAIGITSSVKVVPQYFLNELFSLQQVLSTLNFAGAGLVLFASLLYAWYQLWHGADESHFLKHESSAAKYASMNKCHNSVPIGNL